MSHNDPDLMRVIFLQEIALRTQAFKAYRKKLLAEGITSKDEIEVKFMSSTESTEVLMKLGMLNFVNMFKAIDIIEMEDNIAKLTIDLNNSDNQIKAEINELLRRYRHVNSHVTVKRAFQAPQDMNDIGQMFNAFDLIESGIKALQVTRQLFPQTRGEKLNEDSETKARLEQVTRWHKKIVSLIANL
jgi:hypothetical protein